MSLVNAEISILIFSKVLFRVEKYETPANAIAEINAILHSMEAKSNTSTYFLYFINLLN